MIQKIALLVLLLCLLALALFFVPSQEKTFVATSEGTATSTDAGESVQSTITVQAKGELGRREIVRDEFVPKAVESRLIYGKPVEDGILVTVVDSVSGEPLTAAQVFVIDPDLSPERDKELEMEFASGFDMRRTFTQFGVVYITNEQGQVRVPEQPVEVFLAVCKDKWFDVFSMPPAESLTITLGPPSLIAVQVVNKDGQPVPDAPVALRIRTNFGPGDLLTALTDSSGNAKLEVLDLMKIFEDPEAFDAFQLGEPEFFVALQVLTPMPIESAISLDSLPSKTITFIMPECGKVGVEVLDADGERIKERYFIGLAIADATTTEYGQQIPREDIPARGQIRKTTKQGAAIFPYVALDQQLLAIVESEDGKFVAREVGAGPTSDSGLVAFRLSPEGPWPSFSGRIVNEDGIAAPSLSFDTSFSTEGQGSRGQTYQTITTNANGQFQMSLGKTLDPKVTTIWTIYMPATSRKPKRKVEVNLSPYFQSREHYLGDLVLEPLPFLASGQVVDWNGEAVEGATVSFERIDPNEVPSTSGIPIRRNSSDGAVTDEQGGFTLYGDFREGRFRATASSFSYSQTTLEFGIGETGLLLQLGNTWDVNGAFIFDTSVATDQLRPYLLNDGQEVSDSDYSQWETLKENGHFAFRDQPAGKKRLVLLAASTELYSMELTLDAGGGSFDLGLVDLRGTFHTFTMHITNGDGEYLQNTWAADLGGNRLGWANGEPLHISTQKSSLGIIVGAVDFGTVTLQNVNSDREVTLPSGYPIKLVIDNAPKGRPDVQVMINMTLLDEGGGAKHGGLYSALLFHGFPLSGKSTLPLPGRYEIDATLVDLAGVTSDLRVRVGDGSQLPVVQVLDQQARQVIHVQLNQQDLDVALKRM